MAIDWTKDFNRMVVVGTLTSISKRPKCWIARVETKTTEFVDAVEFAILPDLFASREHWPVGGRVAIAARTTIRGRGFSSHFAEEIFFQGEQAKANEPDPDCGQNPSPAPEEPDGLPAFPTNEELLAQQAEMESRDDNVSWIGERRRG